jgi:hypothetical protein
MATKKNADAAMCLWCGEAYQPKKVGHPQIYCSAKCRTYAWRSQNRRPDVSGKKAKRKRARKVR